MSQDFLNAVPVVCAIPTTAGTGSDGGKSMVITDLKGQKQVIGHPVFLPSVVALVPQFTAGLPSHLTAGRLDPFSCARA